MDIAKVIELWTGIPATKIQESDLKKLNELYKNELDPQNKNKLAVLIAEKTIELSKI